jgi:hypothetical protein
MFRHKRRVVKQINRTLLGLSLFVLGLIVFGVVNANAASATSPRSPCQNIRGPGFWKHYRHYLSDATFQALLNATEDYAGTIPAQAVIILGNNRDKYHKFLLSAELNAVYNGQNLNPGISRQLGKGTYGVHAYPKSSLHRMTVKQILHLAFRTDASHAGAALVEAVKYLGNGGKHDKFGSCLVQ